MRRLMAVSNHMIKRLYSVSEKLEVGGYVSGINLYIFDWKVGNYSMIKPVSEALTSPIFTVQQDQDMTLKICLTPIKDNILKIEVSLSKCFRANCNQNEKLSIKNLCLSFLNSKKDTLDYSMLTYEVSFVNTSKIYLWKKEENISRFLEDDSLTIRAKLSIIFPEDSDEEKKSDNSQGYELLLKDIRKLIDDKNLYPDILVKVGGKIIPAHKVILFSRCPNLEKLMRNGVYDSPISKNLILGENLDVLYIPNENANNFLAVLHYIYCAKLYFSSNVNYFGVCDFAKKYKLQELRMLLAPTEMYTYTVIKTVTVDFSWHVKKFSSYRGNAFVPVVSPPFKTNAGGGETEWNISLYVFDSDNIFLSLQRVNNHETDVLTAFKIILCSADGAQSDIRSYRYFFTSKSACNCYPGFLDSESRFVINSNYLPNDTLIVRCELTIPDGDVIFETKNTYPGEYAKIDKNLWIQNFQSIMENDNYSDAVLEVDKKIFKVHKPILAARSPVFARMFQNEMSEKLSGCVTIEDIGSFTMEIALTYIYTGKLEKVDTYTAIELYRVADKYDIQGLKEECSNYLHENVESDTACQVLILADLYNDEKLKNIAKDFICRRANEALMTIHGQEMMDCYPHLAQNIFESLSAAYCALPPQELSDSDKTEPITLGLSNSLTIK